MRIFHLLLRATLLVATATAPAANASAQPRVRFPSPEAAPTSTPLAQGGSSAYPRAPQAHLGNNIQSFDPYGNRGNAYGSPAAATPLPPTGRPTLPQTSAGNPASTPIFGSGAANNGGIPRATAPGGTPYGFSSPGGAGGTGYPAASGGAPAVGSGPPSYYPHTQTPYPPATTPQPWTSGIFGGDWGAGGAPAPLPYLKLIDDQGFRYTWLYGDSGRDVEFNEADVFVTFNFPRFLFSPQPLSVTPGFTFHFIDGPDSVGRDLPSKAYSGYLDFGWDPQITPRLGAELDARVGVFTDFDTVTTESIRVSGAGLGIIRITPTLKMKLGVEYLNRADIKLLPAGGLLWEPNNMTRFDIYFPRPKLAQYLTTLGNTDFWWYVGGEYGGGTWTLALDPGIIPHGSQLTDYNDIRVFGGLEWTHPNDLTGFFEVGYVFLREVVYVEDPTLSFNVPDTVMLRAGIVW